MHTINIFEVTHPGKVGVFLFDCSSAHEGLAADALNINKMNINLGGKQVHLRSTTIPLNNPPPKPGQPDTHSQPQDMGYPDDHPDPSLQGKAKGIKVVLQERVSVWDKTVEMNSGKVPAGKCRICKKSQVTKDVERRIAEAEALVQEDMVTEEDLANACNPVDKLSSDWCCLYQVLSLQDNFTNEKPMIQHYIEEQGHVCIFLPKSHCELNTIEMLWGFMKYSAYISLLIHISFPLIGICNRILQILRQKVHGCTKTCAAVP